MKKFLSTVIGISNVFSLVYSMDVDPLESLRASQQELMITAQEVPTEVIKIINHWQIIVASVRFAPEMGVTLQDLVDCGVLPSAILGSKDEICQYVFACIVKEKYKELQQVLDTLKAQTIDAKPTYVAHDALVLAAYVFCSHDFVIKYADNLPSGSWKWALYLVIISDKSTTHKRPSNFSLPEAVFEYGYLFCIDQSKEAPISIDLTYWHDCMKNSIPYVLPLIRPIFKRKDFGVCLKRENIDFDAEFKLEYIEYLSKIQCPLLEKLQKRENGTAGRYFILNLDNGLILSCEDLAIDTSNLEHYIEELKIKIGIEGLEISESNNKMEIETSKKS